MSDVTLSKAIRANLLHLQNTARLMDTTQERLATGKKVNSALDNPTNFFTASALNARAGDIGALLDAMSNGVQAIEAADNGLSAITKTLEALQSTLRQARQDKSFQVQSFQLAADVGAVSFDKGAVAGGPVTVNTATTALGEPFTAPAADGAFTIQVGAGTPVSIAVPTTATPQGVADAINADTTLADAGVRARINGNRLELVNASGADLTLGGTAVASVGFAAGATVAKGPEGDVDAMVRAINTDPRVNTAVRASNDNGKLRIENLSTSALEVTPGTGSPLAIDGNSVRANLARVYNEDRGEVDRLVEDSHYAGVNLLRGDELKIVFNESGSSMVAIQTRDRDGNPRPIGTDTLNLAQITPADLDSDAKIDALLAKVKGALDEVRTQAAGLGSSLSMVKNRENFTKQMINTLQTGAASLTLADTNEEAANLLALQTRQQLSQTALSLASQADQAVLRLF